MKPVTSGRLQAQLATSQALLEQGAEVRVHERFGVPTFLWASPQGATAGLAALRSTPAAGQASAQAVNPAEAAARAHLGVYGSFYGLDPADLATATAIHVHDLGRGPVVVQFRQAIDGIEVFRERASVVMDRELRLVAIGGFITGSGAQAFAPAAPASLGAAEAAAAALSDLAGRAVDPGALAPLGAAEGGYERLQLAADPGAEPIRARRTWFHGPAGLLPAWYVELDGAPGAPSELYAHVISAADGGVLFKASLTVDVSNVYTYRVWAASPTDPSNPSLPFDGPQGNAYDPHPTGLVDGTQLSGAVAQNDVSLASTIFCADPWLPLGATETTGNNVEAYANLVTPDGFTPNSVDFHADVTAPNAFLRTYDPTQPNTVSQEKAAVVQMFYNVNFLHDWFYASGFTEPAGNAQADNYGRGGVGGDSIKAQGEDFASRNNANMSTPADGGRPRMRMYLFDGVAARHLFVTGTAAPDFMTGVPSGWGISSHDVSGPLVWVSDGVGANSYPPATTTTKTVHDGCDYTPGAGGAVDPNWAPVTGKVAFIDRGGAVTAPATTCGFSDKAYNAQRAGAIGVLIASTTPHAAAVPGNMALTAGTPAVTIPVYQLSTPDGDAIRTALGQGPVTARLLRDAAVDRDGTVDNQIMFHEWGHYISNRLVANSSGLTTNMAGGLGEGWADFHAMLLTVKEEDVAVASNSAYSGVYGLAVWISAGGSNGPTGNQGVYYGIRRMPYSTDLTKNNQTYKNIQDSSAIPVGAPFAFWPAPNTPAASGGNSEVHNTGEVWATMLWECYAGLLGDTLGATPRLSFAQARDRMKDYLVAAYQLTPPQPTLLEARDALLAVARAGDLQDYHRFLTAFAKRGAGYGAISPDRYSATNNGVTESFVTGADLVFRGAAIADDLVSCDRDGFLDSGETGTLSVTLRNDSISQLTATTAAVSAIGPNAANLTFPAGNTITFGATNPGESVTASIQVALAAGLTGPQPIDLQFSYGDPALLVPDTIATWSKPGNVDDVAGQAQVDDVESSSPLFTTVTLGNVANLTTWIREELTPYQHAYAVADQNGLTDLALLSPLLQPGTSSLVLSFKHRYAFEFSGTTLFDGGVVELTTDNGNTWIDVGGLATGQAYTGALFGGTPLGTRRGFGGFSPGYPASWVTTSIDLGTTYAGQSVRVRFRMASDSNGRANGWEIDDIAFTGLVNRPFRALLPNKCAAGVANRRPTALIGAVAASPERTLVTLPGSGTDLDGDALTYQWAQLSGPPVVLSDPASATPSFTTPDVPAAGGSVVFGLTVFDGTAFSNLVTRSISITNVDRSPTANAGAGQSVPEGTLVQLAGTGADPDGDAVAYAWTQTGGPAVSLLGATGASPSFLAPPVTPAGATLDFQLTVTAGGLSAVATTTVQVTKVNHQPLAIAGPAQVVDERSPVQLAGSGFDADGDALSYAWTQLSPATPVAALSDAVAASPTFTAPDVTADTLFTFQLVVSDWQLSSPPATVTVLVRQVDRGPSASAGASQATTEQTLVQLSGSGSDPDGDALSYLWIQTGGTPVTLSLATSATPTFTAPDVGPDGDTLTFELIVTANGLSASSTTTVVVAYANHSPLALVAPDLRAGPGYLVTLDARSSSDPDGNALTYAWAQVSGPAVILSGAATARPSFTAPSSGEGSVLVFEVTVSDGQGGVATARQQVTVDAVPAPPVRSGGCSSGDAGSFSLFALLALVVRWRRRQAVATQPIT
jgi:hypothetical protein